MINTIFFIPRSVTLSQRHRIFRHGLRLRHCVPAATSFSRELLPPGAFALTKRSFSKGMIHDRATSAKQTSLVSSNLADADKRDGSKAIDDEQVLKEGSGTASSINYIFDPNDVPKQELLDDFEKLAVVLVKRGLMRVFPENLSDVIINFGQLDQLDDEAHAQLYVVGAKLEDGKFQLLKSCGSTGNGEKRSDSLNVYKYHHNAMALTVLDLDLIDRDTNDTIVNGIREISDKHCTLNVDIIQKMTIRDAVEFQEDDDSLSFCLNLLMYYHVKGNASNLYGFEKLLARLMLESGYQMLLPKLDNVTMSEGAEIASQHECFRGKRFLLEAIQVMEEAASDLNIVLNILVRRFGKDFVRYLSKNEVQWDGTTSWKPETTQEDLTEVDVINDRLFSTMIQTVPIKNVTNGFSTDNNAYAVKIEGAVSRAQLPGVVSAMDTCECTPKSFETIAHDYLVKKSWELLHTTSSGTRFYSYREDWWKYPALLLVHRPNSEIFNFDQKQQKWVDMSRKAGKHLVELQLFADFVTIPDAPISADMKDHLLLGNVAVAQKFLEYLVAAFHYYPKRHAAVLFLDLLSPLDVVNFKQNQIPPNNEGIISSSLEKKSRTKKNMNTVKDKHTTMMLNYVALSEVRGDAVNGEGLNESEWRDAQLTNATNVLRKSDKGYYFFPKMGSIMKVVKRKKNSK